MEYQRGRGPILLRLLNDLLRRLPRSQSDSVILSGRILMLLSWVYPLNEKSGVNLRGLFNVDKGFSFEEPEPAKAEGQEAAEGEAAGGQAKMEVEEGEEAEEGKESAEGESPTSSDAEASRAILTQIGRLVRFGGLLLDLLVPPALFHQPPTPLRRPESRSRGSLDLCWTRVVPSPARQRPQDALCLQRRHEEGEGPRGLLQGVVRVSRCG